MAAVIPTPARHCKGTFANGDADIRLKCVKSVDPDGTKIYTCATWRYFRVTCSKVNRQCNALSGAYVAAVTVCNQRLY